MKIKQICNTKGAKNANIRVRCFKNQKASKWYVQIALSKKILNHLNWESNEKVNVFFYTDRATESLTVILTKNTTNITHNFTLSYNAKYPQSRSLLQFALTAGFAKINMDSVFLQYRYFQEMNNIKIYDTFEDCFQHANCNELDPCIVQNEKEPKKYLSILVKSMI
jgi:hypothetical protein